MGIMQLINIILFWFLFGFIASHFAKKRGRSPLAWFMIGLSLGLIGILLLFILPKLDGQSAKKHMQPLMPKKSEAWLKMWYYLDPAHAQQGPFEFPDLIKKWKEKGITETSYIWGEGMADWKRISDLPDIVEEIEKA